MKRFVMFGRQSGYSMPQFADIDNFMTGQDEMGAPRVAVEGANASKMPSHRRGIRLLAFCAVILAGASLAFLGGFAAFATHVARLATPVEQSDADAIIVLTGGQARINAAINLLKSGKGQRLLISGVHPAARRVDLQLATGGDEGLFSCCVDIDRAALDTIGNAEESAKWVNTHAYGSVIVVTNNYHMPRSLLELKRMIGETVLLPYPVVNARLDDGEWVTNRAALRVLFTEYTKYLASMVRGALPRFAEETAVTASVAD